MSELRSALMLQEAARLTARNYAEDAAISAIFEVQGRRLEARVTELITEAVLAEEAVG